MSGGSRGSSLISVVLGLGVISGVAGILFQRQATLAKAKLHDEVRDDLASVSLYLRRNLDCEATVTGKGCSGDILPLIDLRGDAMDKIGKWNVRGSCSGGRLMVQVARVHASGFKKDPLTGIEASWTSVTDPVIARYYGEPKPDCHAVVEEELPERCISTPAGGSVLCTEEQPPARLGWTGTSWGGQVACPTGTLLASCGMTTGGYAASGGHYAYPALQNGRWTCICNIGFVAVYGPFYCTASCIRPK